MNFSYMPTNIILVRQIDPTYCTCRFFMASLSVLPSDVFPQTLPSPYFNATLITEIFLYTMECQFML